MQIEDSASEIRFLVIFQICILTVGLVAAEITYSGETTGNPSDWTSSTNAYVAYFNAGSVTVNGGDDIVSKSGRIGFQGDGEVTIDGLGSSWHMSSDIYVGLSDGYTANLNISNGASVVNNEASIGLYTNTNGTVEVKGQGSLWQTDRLYVGHEGNGILRISDGAHVSCREGYAGYYENASGIIEINGNGSTFYSDLSVNIGNFAGSGSLNIQHGAVFSAYNVGVGTGGLGVVNVDGIDSKLICRDGSLSIGRGVKGGIVNVSNHGLVIAEDVDAGYYHGFDTEDYGYVNLDSGGTLALLGDIDNSIQQFLTKVDGDEVIRFWDYGLSDWSFITNATIGEDYFLEYISDVNSELYGFTTLTIVPEPAACVLLSLGVLLVRKKKRTNSVGA